MSPHRPVRKPNSYGGIQVVICGLTISKESNIICHLPKNIAHRYHCAVALDTYGIPVFLVLLPGGEVRQWIMELPAQPNR